MHDRRVNGEPLTFGNQGALYKHAMVWWDHSKRSIWSQPVGRAIFGELEGVSLELVAAELVPWSTWLSAHPDTTAMVNRSVVDQRYEPFDGLDFFVIGVPIGDSATAYRYEEAASKRVINDLVGESPVVVFVEPETRGIRVYLRVPVTSSPDAEAPGALTFKPADDGFAVDAETGSVWDPATGIAVEGPLKGAILQQVPYISAYEWAWLDFYPHATVYGDQAS